MAVIATALFVLFYVRMGRLAPDDAAPPPPAVSLPAAPDGSEIVTGKTKRARASASKRARKEGVVQVEADALPAVHSYRDALDLALEETDPIDRSMAFGRLFNEWFASEPDAALEYLRGLPPSPEYTSGMLLALTAVGKSDPSRALALAQRFATNDEQQVVYSVLFDTFARRDLRAAEQLLGEAPPGVARESAIRALAARWADDNLENALVWAQQLKEPADRAPAVETALFSLAALDPWRALDVAARDLDGEPLERTVARVMQRLGEIDPEQAGRILKILPEGETQTHIAFDLARTLAASNPVSATAWVSNLPDEETRRLALNNVLDVWVDRAAADAQSFVAKMPAGGGQDAAAAHTAVRLAGSDPLAAARWAETLASESARRAALVGVATGWAQQDAPAAARWAAELPTASPARAEAIYSAVSYWALSDADAATAFAKKIKPASARAEAMRALAPPPDTE